MARRASPKAQAVYATVSLEQEMVETLKIELDKMGMGFRSRSAMVAFAVRQFIYTAKDINSKTP